VDYLEAHARLDGNFPAGTADLKWHLTIAGDRITRLEIVRRVFPPGNGSGAYLSEYDQRIRPTDKGRAE
jgi:hypothetical protein